RMAASLEHDGEAVVDLGSHVPLALRDIGEGTPHRDRVPPDYERRQTLSGAERYVTPELKEYEAKVLGAEERIAAREAELVDALRGAVAEVIARVQVTATTLAQLDVWSALADVAHREGYARPEVNAEFAIALEGSRHPVVERMMARE